jgi:hypothetical protein
MGAVLTSCNEQRVWYGTDVSWLARVRARWLSLSCGGLGRAAIFEMRSGRPAMEARTPTCLEDFSDRVG